MKCFFPLDCRAGQFGPNCLQFCDCLHEAPCNATDGTCYCPPGWVGSRCEKGKLNNQWTALWRAISWLCLISSSSKEIYSHKALGISSHFKKHLEHDVEYNCKWYVLLDKDYWWTILKLLTTSSPFAEPDSNGKDIGANLQKCVSNWNSVSYTWNNFRTFVVSYP